MGFRARVVSLTSGLEEGEQGLGVIGAGGRGRGDVAALLTWG